MTIQIIVLITAVISVYALSSRPALEKMMLNPYQVVHHKQYWRVITHGFIHGDYLHLFFNMYVLWEFGRPIFTIFTNQVAFTQVMDGDDWWGSHLGQNLFLMMYLGAIFVASVPALIKHRNNPGYNSLGASGAVSAVVLIFVLLFPTSTLYLFFAIPIPAFLAGILFFVYESYMNKRGGTGVARDAHLFGALYGLLFMALIAPSSITGFVGKLMELIN